MKQKILEGSSRLIALFLISIAVVIVLGLVVLVIIRIKSPVMTVPVGSELVGSQSDGKGYIGLDDSFLDQKEIILVGEVEDVSNTEIVILDPEKNRRVVSVNEATKFSREECRPLKEEEQKVVAEGGHTGIDSDDISRRCETVAMNQNDLSVGNTVLIVLPTNTDPKAVTAQSVMVKAKE